MTVQEPQRQELRRAALEEVEALHRFFVTWFAATVERTAAEFSACADVLGADFQIVFPSSICLTRDELLGELEGAHGNYQSSTPPFRIWIEKAEPRPLADDLCLVTYQEWQELDGEITGRTSSALLKLNPGAARGMEWLHVHETALPSAS